MSERTPADRARARWEREAKRAAKRGEPPPPPPPELAEPEPPPAEPEPRASEPPPVEPEPRASAPPPVQPPQPEPPPPPPQPAPPQVEPEPPPPPPQQAPPQVEPEPPQASEPAARPARSVETPPAHDTQAEDALGETQEWSVTEEWAAEPADEEPYGEPYDPYGEPEPHEDRYDPYGEGLPPDRPDDWPAVRSGAAVRPRRRWRIAAVAIVGGVIAVAAAWFLLSLFQPLKGDGSGEVAVTIPEGSGSGEIADILEREGVISSATFFRLRASLSGRSGDFKAGDFKLREDMSYAAAIDALVEPPVPDTITVTIPEGLSRREAAAIVGDSGLRGDYMAATRKSSALKPGSYGAKGARDLEGFLFPATYELEPGQRVGALVRQQLAAFKRNLRQVNLRHARSKKLTPYDVVTIASMIDREAMIPRERRLVASVIYNRLSQGIPLGIDATIRFATGNWSEPLKQSELAIDSGYNTRLNQGLPPGPIGNPGLAALRAAANPADTEYIYYVVKPCANGAHAFSETDAEFQRDVARYNAERERQGGKSPTEC